MKKMRTSIEAPHLINCSVAAGIKRSKKGIPENLISDMPVFIS